MGSVPIMVSDGRRICGRKRGREDKSGRAERDSRNSKSAKSHGNSLSCWATQQRRGNTPFAPERYAHHTMKPPSQVGNGDNYLLFDSLDRGAATFKQVVRNRPDSDERALIPASYDAHEQPPSDMLSASRKPAAIVLSERGSVWFYPGTRTGRGECRSSF